MNAEERFQFDLHGYLVVPKILSATDLEELNHVADDNEGEWKNGMFRTCRVSRWSPACQALIDHEKLLPYLEGFLGPWFRIDHDYCIFMSKGSSSGGLHGGPHPQINAGDHWYQCHNGIIRNGLTVFTFLLTDAPAGAGGFACVPGSHKSNFVSDLPTDVRHFDRNANYVCQPVGEAGDLIIFTEALVHGTMPWKADHERRSFLFKYSPGHSSWASDYYDPDSYPAPVSDRQRRIMAPPFVGGRVNSVSGEPL